MNPLFNNLNKAFYGATICFMFLYNKINSLGNNNEPARLNKIEELSWREKYEVELIFAMGIGVIVLLFLFAFLVVGQMDPYYNGGLV